MNGHFMTKQIIAAALLLATALATLPGIAQQVAQTDAETEAESVPEDQILVLACLENIEQSTTWGQCLNLMFQPCAQQEVGSDGHANCLRSERTRWRATMENLQEQVFDVITVSGGSELAGVMGQWTGYVAQKCQEVAATRAETGPESARLGCEITEFVGLTGEFAACLEGRSNAPYCQYKAQ